MASEDDDYEVYQYSDEDGYSVEDDTEEMDLDPNENPNAPPVQYSKIGMFLFVAFRRCQPAAFRRCQPACLLTPERITAMGDTLGVFVILTSNPCYVFTMLYIVSLPSFAMRLPLLRFLATCIIVHRVSSEYLDPLIRRNEFFFRLLC